MAQVLKLKRTAVSGKIPTTSNLELGELALNTYDGRIFFEKDSGTPVISEILTTNTENYITGSLTLGGNIQITGTVTASFFVGDGSQLTNLPNSDVSQVATVTSSFDNQSSITVTHNFGSKNVFISVYDANDSQIIPQSVVLTNNNTVTITLSGTHSGYVVVGKGGHIVSGTLVQEISEVATVTASFDNQSSISVTHNFESRNVIVSVYDSNYSQLIPETLTLTDENSVDIVLSGNHSGHVVVAKGGHFVSGSIITEADFTELTNVPSGLVSSSNQLTSSLDTRYALSGSNGEGGVSSWNELTDIPSGLVSSSTQITNGSGLVSGSVLTTLDGTGVFSGSSQIQFNDVSNTPLSQSTNTVTISKSLIPTTTEIDLGTAERPFRDLYLSSASLYIDGQQVLSSNASTLTITTDLGQSIKLLEQGSDDITLQTEDGNIELKGTVELQTGKKIIDSGGTQILFGNSLGITGSINLTGTVNGVNVSELKSNFDNIGGKSLISGSSQVIYTSLSSIPAGIVSGSSQVISILGGLNAYTASNDSINTTQNSRLTALEGATSSYQPTLSVSDTTNVDLTLNNNTLSATLSGGVVSGSSQVSYIGLSSIPSGIVSGSSQITAGSTANFATDVKSELNSNTIVSGSSQILTLVSIDEDTMVSNSDTKVPTQQSVKQYVDTKVAALVSGSPETLDTLNELASALGNDPNFATTISNQIGGKVSQSLQVIAGNGLSGGGDLTTNRTLDVVSANNGIVINSDNIQLDTTSTTFTSGVKTKLNADGVVSGSSQISFSGIVDKPTLVSGSSQVISILGSLNSYTSSNDTTNTTQNSRLGSLETKTGSLDSTNTTQNSRLTSIESATGSYETKGRGIVSGSSQVSYTGLSSIPSGIVSGSSQITLSSTTGYGSVINQALLTTSSPTFVNGTFSKTTINADNSGLIVDVSGRHGIMKYINYATGFVGKNTGTDSNISVWLGRWSGTDINSPSSINQDLTINNSGNATFGGTVTSTGFILGNGQFLRGTRTSGGLVINLLGIESGTDRTMMTITGDYVIQNGSNAALLTMTTTGNATFAGTLTENSSIRYKENIETIESGLDKVIQLRGVTYIKKDSGEKEMGLIAEEVYDVLPEVILKNEDGEIDSISYGRITAVLIEGMKEQQKQIQELKLEIELLKQR